MLSIPQNWRALPPDHKLAQMTRQVIKEARDRGWLMPTPGYDIDLYTFSSRRNWGQARSERATVTMRYLRHAVGLNRLFLAEPDKALTTICHEVAHCCCPSDRHGAQWHQIASALATKFNAPRAITVKTSQKQVGIEFDPITWRNAPHASTSGATNESARSLKVLIDIVAHIVRNRAWQSSNLKIRSSSPPKSRNKRDAQ